MRKMVYSTPFEPYKQPSGISPLLFNPFMGLNVNAPKKRPEFMEMYLMPMRQSWRMFRATLTTAYSIVHCHLSLS